MANAAQTPKLQIGKLSPEDAERLASTFRPIWELDDAPFAQGSALSAAEIDALSAGAGVAPSVRQTDVVVAAPKPVPVSTPGHVPAPDAPKVEVSIELDPADLVTATPPPAQAPAPIVAEARPQPPQAPPAKKPYAAPRPPPEPINMRHVSVDGSGELVPVKKSNTGLILGAVAVLAIIGVVVGVKVMGGDKTASSDKANTSSTSPGHEETTHIPPPPEATQVQAQQAPTATQTQAPAPVATAAKTNDSPIVKEFPTTAPTHTQATATNVAAPVHTTHTAATHTGGTKPATTKPAIVRDNPF
jgi:hypothetical protein